MPEPAAAPGFAWNAGPIDAFTDSTGTTLRLMPAGGTLTVRHGRLRRGPGYAATPRADRQFLARVGAIIRLRERGLYHLHGAGVVDPRGRGWVLAGDNGAGKSTLAYALVRSGWKLLGDDGVILENAANGLVAHAWREPLAVSSALVGEFPELAGVTAPADFHDERGRVPMRFPVAQLAPVAALVFLRRGEIDAIEPMPSVEVLTMLVKQSAWVLMKDRWSALHLAALRELVARTPLFRLTHTSRQLHGIAATLSAALP